MNPLQQAALRRKIGYLGAILALFTLTLFWRGTLAVPLAGKVQAATWVSSHTILNRSESLELRELNTGEADLAGSAVRLLLLGSRGLAVTYLWFQAIEKQKRNDFHELEVLVQQVTKLQPRFVTPWVFQAWNIAYNVSVETDRLNDMYFYIGRGIQLLAEGERRNRAKATVDGATVYIGSPDMRYQIGFMYRNKFGVSDKVQTLRCLFALSCIPPADRDPNGLRGTDDGVDPAAFREFCEKYPHLVRRLREKLGTRRPEGVVQFLEANAKVMGRYKPNGEFAARMDQFPIVPEAFDKGPDEAQPGRPVEESFSGFGAARAWFVYSMEMLPPNPADEFGRPVPAATPRTGEYDPFVYRVPRSPMLILFRQDAARSQTYQAELEQKEGWFDASGWRVDDPSDPQSAWFFEADVTENGEKRTVLRVGEAGRNLKPGEADDGGRRVEARRVAPVVLGTKRAWSLDEWRQAYQAWKNHSEAYALVMDDARLESLRAEAQSFPSEFRVAMDPSPEQREDAAYMRAWRAKSALFYYDQNRNVTNAPFFIISSAAEQKPETVQARKSLWEAEQARKTGESLKAMMLYRQGLEQWKKVLLDNPKFHRMDRADRTEEETYEMEREYTRLVEQHEPQARQRAREVANGLHAVIPYLADPYPADAALRSLPPTTLPTAARDELLTHAAQRFFSPFAEPVPSGEWAGTPWVRKEVKSVVESRDAGNRKPGSPAQARDGG